MTPRTRHLPLILVLLLAAGVAPLFAQTEGGEGEEKPAEAAASTGEPVLATGIHPSYALTYDRNRDQATWDHAFNFTYGFTPRMSLTSSANVRRKSSLGADRVSRIRSCVNGIDFRVAQGLTMGLEVSRNWSEDETGGAAESKARLQEGLEIHATYDTRFLDLIQTTVVAGAGQENREYSDIVSRGDTERIQADFAFAPVENLQAKVGYAGNLRLSDSEQAGFQSRDRNVDEKMTASADYTLWKGQVIGFTATGQRTEAQYPSGGAQETRTMYDRNVGINTDVELLPGFKVGIRFDAGDAETEYRLTPDRYNRNSGHGLQVVIPKRPILLGFSGNISLQDDQRRNEFRTPQTGTTTKHTLLGGLDRALGPRSLVSLKGRVELVRYEFDDRVKNQRDRDILSQDFQMSLEYKPTLLQATVDAEYKRTDQINIMPAGVGDNSTRHTYSVRPGLSMKLWRSIRVNQNYTLSADYTLYHTDETRNLLVRTAGLGTRVQFPLLPGVSLSVAHDYSLQDQGGYQKDVDGVNRYARARENERQRFSVDTGLQVSVFEFQISQAYEYNKQWDYVEQKRRLKYDASSIEISGSLNSTFNLTKDTTFNLSLQQTQKAGKRLSENEKKFWNINASARHQF